MRLGWCVVYSNGERVCNDPEPPQHDCQIIMEYFPAHRHITMGEDVFEMEFLHYPLYGKWMDNQAFDELVTRAMDEGGEYANLPD